MIPQWNKKLDLSTLSSIQTHVENQDYTNVLTSIKTLQKNCDSCHNDYQAITALTYRAPDFSAIEVDPLVPLNTHMQTLTKQVNQIKIASEDSMPSLALVSLSNLKRDMNKLGQVCVDCHKKDKKPYPSPLMKKTLISLEDSLKTGTLKEQGRHLGTLAVLACARCHGTHRLASGAKAALSKEPNLSELLKH
jgi:cytochrome c556